MKHLAHTQPSIDSPIVFILDVVAEKKKSTIASDQKIYYSLWTLNPMKVVVGKKKASHFAYLSGGGGGIGGGESIEHAFAKYMIYKCKELPFRQFCDKELPGDGVVRFSEVRMEYGFDNRKYIADLYARIDNDSVLGLKKGDWLVIEICKTHKAENQKKRFFRNQQIPALEIKLYDKIQYTGDRLKLEHQIMGWLRRHVYIYWLYDPLFDYTKYTHKRPIAAIHKPQTSPVKTAVRKLPESNVIDQEVDPYAQFKVKDPFHPDTVIDNEIENKTFFQRFISRLLSLFN